MARVELEHAEKVYPGGTAALADVTLEVADGELLVLVGPSGSGKSTVLRIVAGLDALTGGTLRIGDQDATRLRPQERNVAMVFQDYALYPYLTARGNLEFPLKMRRLGRDERRQRVETTARLLDIEALLERLPKQLSGGQRQRVAMGRALVREPAVFLLDEPLSNLDAKLRVQVRAEIKELQARTRTTMLYVTHDQVEAMTLGDRVAVLDKGRLQQVAPPREIYERPANAFVAGFMGNPPMNLFPVLVVAEGDARVAIRLGDRTLLVLPAGTLGRRTGATMTGGIRPEGITLATGDAARDGIPATVEHVEFLGHETLAYVAVAGAHLVARVPGMVELEKGARVFVRLEAARIHLFDESGIAYREGR